MSGRSPCGHELEPRGPSARGLDRGSEDEDHTDTRSAASGHDRSTRITAVAGMLFAATGLWQISTATTSTTYSGVVLGMTLLGVGAGLVIPSVTGSVMSSVPVEHTGVGGGTNGTFIQTGGALGVAVVGSLLSTRYDDHVTSALASYRLPPAASQAVHDTFGAALAVAHKLGGPVGGAIADAARSAFMSGMHLGLVTAALVVLVGAVVALLAIPGKEPVARAADAAKTDAAPIPH